MTTAEELLDELVAVHDHAVTDSDTYFIIDPITRKINNTARKKNTIMQRDHNSEVFTFQLPRYVEGHDMSLCNRVTVHWDNVDGETGEETSEAYDLDDLHVSPDDENIVLCSWTITRNSTQRVGILSFLLHYKCADENGDLSYEWHTDYYDEIEIKATRNNGEASVIDYTDILEQWYAKIFGTGDAVLANIAASSDEKIAAIKAEGETQVSAVTEVGATQIVAVNEAGASQVSAITNEGVAQTASVADSGNTKLAEIELKGSETLDSIPEDYTATYNLADEAIRTKADVVTLADSGTSINLADSSDDHLRGLKMYGRTIQKTLTGAQLFNPYTEQNNSFGNAIIENEGAKITVTGNYYVSWPITLKAGVTYYINFTVTGDTEYRAVRFEYPDKAITNTITNPASFTPTQDTVSVYLYAGLGTEGTVTYENVTISEGTAAVPWEPYCGGMPSPNPLYPQDLTHVENPVIDICGKNLLRNELSVGVTETRYGVNFTTYADKSVHVSGTPNRAVAFNFMDNVFLPAATYCLSGAPSNASTKFRLQVNYKPTIDGVEKTGAVDMGSAVTFTLPYDAYVRAYIYVAYDVGTVDGVFHPQLAMRNTKTVYEPYVDAQSFAIPRSIRAIPVSENGNYTDSNGQQWICDEIDFERGVYTQRVGSYEVTGSENWVVSEYQPENIATVRFDANVVNVPGGSNIIDALCTHYPFNGLSGGAKREGIWVASNPKTNQLNLRIMWYYETVDELVAFLADQYANGTPVTFYYALTNFVETPLTAEELLAFRDLHTNYPSTTIVNNANTLMDVVYNADTKTYIDNPKTLRLADEVTGVVYELRVVNGSLTIEPLSELGTARLGIISL